MAYATRRVRKHAKTVDATSPAKQSSDRDEFPTVGTVRVSVAANDYKTHVDRESLVADRETAIRDIRYANPSKE